MYLKNITGLIVASLSTLPGIAFATNGYFLPGYGAKSVGMGGASIAFGQDAIVAASNPATIFDVGTRFDVGLGLFNPPRRAYVDARGSFFGDNVGEARSKNDWFPVPNFGFAFQFTEKLAFGLAAYGNGLGTKYKPNFYDFTGTGRAGDALGVDLIQLLLPVTVAYRPIENQSLALSAIYSRQRFRIKGISSFAAVSSDSEHLTDRGYDYSDGGGIRVGWKGDFLDKRLSLGATYSSKIYMSKFDEYKGLFAEQGDFDIPANFGIGIALKPTDKVTLDFDWMRIQYSDVNSIGNRGPKLFTGDPLGSAASPSSRVGALGTDDGMGFGWEDQDVYKFGVNWNLNDKWTLRAGYNYGETPIPDSELAFNVLAPATVEKHLAVGGTYNLGEQSIMGFGSSAELSFAYLRAFRNKQSGLSALGTNQETGQEFAGYAELEMEQNQFEISYGLKF